MSDALRRSSRNGCELEAALVAAMRADLPPQGSRAQTLARLTGWAPLVAVVLFAKRTLACHAPWLHAGVGALVVGGAVAGIASVQAPQPRTQVDLAVAGSAHSLGHTPQESPAHSGSELAAASPVHSPASTTPLVDPYQTSDALKLSVSAPDSTPRRAARVAGPSTMTAANARVAVSSLTIPAHRARASTSNASSESSGEALDAEVAVLYGVQAALVARLPAVALERLAEYERTFPNGDLRTEAKVLRVNALLQSGERERGEALGRAMLRANPNGTHAGRLRALLDRRDR